MRITRVYTRAGDGGETRLVGNQKVSKDDARIEAFGTIDELNAVLGLVRATIGPEKVRVQALTAIDAILDRVQNDLFDVGADLATRPADRWPGMDRVDEKDVTWLEGRCDELNEQLGPLTEFILPGGGPVGAFLHQARTVCRRAERRIVSLAQLESEGAVADSLRYVNRLSDLLFVLSRTAARATGHQETLWVRRERGSDSSPARSADD
ncbi:MAG: cob(I)yrinic acid a,c-diamide adenosyltransferase [Planctomycetota bacterium]